MSDSMISLVEGELCGVPDSGGDRLDRLSGEAMLEAAVPILALAVLRRKARSPFWKNLHLEAEKDLLRLRNRAFIHDNSSET